MLHFASDYLEGAHPQILATLSRIGQDQHSGYGTDQWSERARTTIRALTGLPDAPVHLLVGGTQANATVIDAVLSRYQGVVAADTGHIALHEAGAIEAGGHKVMAAPGDHGKLSASALNQLVDDFWGDANHEHMVEPGMVYISHPTEYGTLCSREELIALHEICARYQLPLFLDGARLGYGLASGASDVSLRDIAEYCDVFTIGGTKVGAFCGEAVVFSRPELADHFMTITKQHGGLLAKGWLVGAQFCTLLSPITALSPETPLTPESSPADDATDSSPTDDDARPEISDTLYGTIAANAIKQATAIRHALMAKGYQLAMDSPTNQLFIVLTDDDAERLSHHVEMGFWERHDSIHVVMRIATSWATTDEAVDELISIL